MATSSSSSFSSSASPPPSSGASSSADGFSSSEWTQRSMLSDLAQQKGLLIGLGILIGAFLLFGRRSAPEEKAARRLVRDLRKVDDPDDARDLLGENLPTILRPALLVALTEIERQVHQGFAQLEKALERL